MALSPYYASATWPAYQFREFPKMLTPNQQPGESTEEWQRRAVIVNNEDEELAALEAMDPAVRPPAPVDVGAMQRQIEALMAQVAHLTAKPEAPDERAPMWAEAEERGIFVDKRWGIDRLRAALAV